MSSSRGRGGDGLYRKRGIWYFRMVDWTGKRHAVSTRTTVFSEAQSIKREHLESRENGADLIGSGRTLFSLAAQRWVERRLLEAADETKLNYKKQLGHILPALGSLRLGQLTGDVIRRYQITRSKELSARTHKPTAASSINNETIMIGSILRENRMWARVREDVHYLKEPESIGRRLTDDEKERLLKVAESRRDVSVIFLVMRLALETGLRHKEIRTLRRKSIDLNENRLLIARESTKTNAGKRIVPLSPVARDIVVDLLHRADELGATEPDHYIFPGRPIVDGHYVITPTIPMKSFADAWSTMRRLAKVDKTLRIHDLRHHFATEMAEAGVPTSVAMRLMGWSGPSTRKRYEHIQDTALRQAMDTIAARRETKQPDPKPPKAATGEVIAFPRARAV